MTVLTIVLSLYSQNQLQFAADKNN